MNWCLYHSEQAQFLGPVTETRMPGPVGRYSCCGQQAFRYETLPGPMVKLLPLFCLSRKKTYHIQYVRVCVCVLFQGCQYREHTVQILNDRDRAILKLAQVAAEGNCLYEPAPNKLLKASILNDTWWNGIILTPSKDRPGLLPPIVLAGKDDIYIFFTLMPHILTLCSVFHLYQKTVMDVLVAPKFAFNHQHRSIRAVTVSRVIIIKVINC